MASGTSLYERLKETLFDSDGRTRVDSLSSEEHERLTQYLRRIQYYQPAESASDGLDALYYGRPGGDEGETCLADAKGLPNKMGSSHYVKLVSRYNIVPYCVDTDASCMLRDFGTESIAVEDDEQLTQRLRDIISDSEQAGTWDWGRLFTMGAAQGDVWGHAYRPQAEDHRFTAGAAVSVETADLVYPYLTPHDQRLAETRIMYRYKGEQVDLTRPGARIWASSWHSYVEHTDEQETHVYIDNELVPELGGPHDLASIGELPLVHFAHVASSHGFFGVPTCHGRYEEIDRLNVLASYFDAAIRMHTIPKAILRDLTKPAGESFWDMRLAVQASGANAGIQFASWNVDYGFINWMDKCVQQLYSRTPQFALSEAFAHAGAEAAATVRYRLFQLDNHVARLEASYTRSLRQLCRCALYLATGQEVPARSITINWGERFPADSRERLERYKLEQEVFGQGGDVIRAQAEAEGWEPESVEAIVASRTKRMDAQPAEKRDRRMEILEAMRQARREAAAPPSQQGGQSPREEIIEETEA